MVRRYGIMLAALIGTAGVPAAAQDAPPQDVALRLDRADYFEAPGVNWLIFSNVNEGLFADAKISGVELIQQRSEEHTSELQSLMRISYAVFCLKKKTKIH